LRRRLGALGGPEKPARLHGGAFQLNRSLQGVAGVQVVLILAVVFLVGSVAAGAFGFAGAASGGRTLAKVLAGVLLLAFLLLVLLTFGGAS
jgi:uncharacterized membrane protein YtjA (UPF0391 family)